MTTQTQTHAASKPSRAQAIRDMVEIRLAVNEAGPLIALTLNENGIVLEAADWSKVFPHWLIATVDDQVIGCVQVIPSMPVGYLEFLLVRPEVPFKFRAIAIRKLMLQGFATLHLNGCSYVGATVAIKNFQFANVIEKLNAKVSYSGDLFVKRLV